MPTVFMRSPHDDRIHYRDYERTKFASDDIYTDYTHWLMQQIAHFETDAEGKRFLMKGQESNVQKKF